MASLFALVAVCSTLADAVRLDRAVVRSVDRAVGAVALSASWLTLAARGSRDAACASAACRLKQVLRTIFLQDEKRVNLCTLLDL